MLFHYTASDAEGKVVEADFDAETLEQVLQFLGSKHLRPVTVAPVAGRRRWSFLSREITIADKVFLTKYLSLMLKVGTDLLSAINVLLADFDKPAVRELLLELRESLTKGQPFYQAFERHPRSFSPVFINLVKAAEESGNLQSTFEGLSASLQEEAELRSKIRAALVYPIILFIVASAVIIFLVTFALPKIAEAFSQTGIRPPAFSRIVFGVGLFIGAHLAAVLGTLVVVAAFLVYFFWRNTLGRRILSRIMQRLPIVRSVYRQIAIQRFASTFAALMRSGLPIVQTVHITADVVGAEEFRVALNRIADEGLTKGLTLGEAFKREPTFPSVVTNLIAISERAGHLDEVMETLAKFYSASVESSLRSLVSFLEPFLLLSMGLMVGLIALAIIVPIYQLTAQF